LVTEVDLKCEQRILSFLQTQFPHHEFYAEEGGKSKKTSPFRWLIDPLDGTTNYAHGYPVFCTSLALEKKGEIIVGVVYNPVLKELFTAQKGKGAFLNGERIVPSSTLDLEKSLLVTGFPYHIKKSRQNIRQFNQFLLQAQAVRRDGSAALNLCYTAMGRFDGYWEFSLAPWDLAAGSLILTEAGGKISGTKGEPLSIYRGNVLASNGKIHSRMLRVLRKQRT
jgi:myo-inositol-1(or 4)-monophosphatase